MVIAAFLNTHLLEPRKQRLRAEGFNEGQAQGRAATLAEVRSLLQEQGFNLDEIALPHAGDTEFENAERC